MEHACANEERAYSRIEGRMNHSAFQLAVAGLRLCHVWVTSLGGVLWYLIRRTTLDDSYNVSTPFLNACAQYIAGLFSKKASERCGARDAGSGLPLDFGCAPRLTTHGLAVGNLLLWRREWEWVLLCFLCSVPFVCRRLCVRVHLGSGWIWWSIEGCQL